MAKASKTTAKKKVGRPSAYTPALAALICDRIAGGESLRTICLGERFPNRSTVLRWLEQHTDFAAIYARAREAQADHEFDEIKAIADETPETEEVRDRNGELLEIRLSASYVAWQRNRIEARKWRAERLKPKAYGTKITNEHTGKDGGAIETVELTPREVAQRAAFLLAKGAKAK